MCCKPFSRWLVGLLACFLFLAADDASAQRRRGRRGVKKKAAAAQLGRPVTYRSKNFMVRTDLAPEEAKKLLERLETMLALISKYWGQPNRKIIECYVVEDLENWEISKFPPEGLAALRAGAGVTLSLTVVKGNVSNTKSVVYAVADRGTPQHEAVHAYCFQTFGRSGPTWYSEGMAEMGQYWRKDDSSVNCHRMIAEYLRRSEPKSFNAIINGDQFSGDSWQNYAWRWALCHLLANNPNYAPRFRPLGLALLARPRGASFSRTYGAMEKEIIFEYLEFLKHLERGYRVDLCSWDWKAKFRSLRGARALTAEVEAGRGWQPTQLLVKPDREYEYSAGGRWQLEPEGEPLSADGDDEGRGRLMGVLLFDRGERYELGEPFELGTYGSFAPEEEGQLWVRCRDEWTELADNEGTLELKIKLRGNGIPLPKPEEAGEEEGDAAGSGPGE